MNKEQNNTKFPFGTLFLGIGLGAIAGGSAAYVYSARKARKRVRNVLGPELHSLNECDIDKRMQEICQEVYNEGFLDGHNSYDQWFKENGMIINGETIEEMSSDLQKQIIAKKVMEQDESSESDDTYAVPGTLPTENDEHRDEENTSKIPDSKPLNEGDPSLGEPPVISRRSESVSSADEIFEKSEEDDGPVIFGRDNIEFGTSDGTIYKYPKSLFMNEKGELLGEIEIRQNLRDYITDVHELNTIWNLLGWGNYIPDEDPRDYDVSIDDNELQNLGDEPEVKTKEREKFMEDIDRRNEGPRIISRKEFDDECYLEKDYWDYYDVDNVFTANTDVDQPIENVYEMVGVANGNDLFGVAHFNEDEDDNDPDIVHIKNFKMNTVLEITRFHRSYEEMKNGGIYLDGGSNQT